MTNPHETCQLQAWDQQHPGISVEFGSRGGRRLRLACEAAKHELSVHNTTAIDLVELTGPNQVADPRCLFRQDPMSDPIPVRRLKPAMHFL